MVKTTLIVCSLLCGCSSKHFAQNLLYELGGLAVYQARGSGVLSAREIDYRVGVLEDKLPDFRRDGIDVIFTDGIESPTNIEGRSYEYTTKYGEGGYVWVTYEHKFHKIRGFGLIHGLGHAYAERELGHMDQYHASPDIWSNTVAAEIEIGDDWLSEQCGGSQ